MDEESNQAENIDVPADVTESPTVEATEAPAEAPEITEEVQEQPKARNNAVSRLKEVLGENKQLKSQNTEYAEMLQRTSQMQVPDNLTEDQFRALTADATYAAQEVQGLKRQLAYKDFTQEVDAVEQKYPELNPDSDSYNEKLAEALSKLYEEDYIEVDKNGGFVKVKKSLDAFSKPLIEAYRTAEVRGAGKTQEAIAKQAAEAVVTADTTNNSASTAFKDLSIDEMEKKLGVVRL